MTALPPADSNIGLVAPGIESLRSHFSGRTAANEGTPDLVGAPHDEREGGNGGELPRRQSRGTEEAVQSGQVHQREGEGQRDGDPAQQQLVGEQADLT
jgi:hypothetical protein